MSNTGHIRGCNVSVKLYDISGSTLTLTGDGNEFAIRHQATMEDATGYAGLHGVSVPTGDEYVVDFSGYWAGSGADSAASKLHALVGPNASAGTWFLLASGGSLAVDKLTYSGSANVETLDCRVSAVGVATWAFVLTPRSGSLHFDQRPYLAPFLMTCHYDGPTPNETDYSGSPDGQQGQTATTAGGVIYRPGEFGKGVQIAGSAKNLCENPQFYANITDFWNDDGDGTKSRNTSKYYIGQASLKIVAGSAVATEYSDNIAVASGASVVLQARAWMDSALDVELLLRDVTNSQNRATDYASSTGAWELLSASWANDTGASINASIHLSNRETDEASECWFDAVQMEVNDHITPYCDGSMGDGHSWSGDAHDSTSTRTHAELGYSDITDTLSTTQGTIAAWIVPNWDSGDAVTLPRIFQMNNSCLVYDNTVSKFKFKMFNGSEATATNATTLIPDASVHIALTWDSDGTITLYVNGVANGTGTAGSETPSSAFSVGDSSAGGTRPFEGVIDDLIILTRALTAAEVAALYKSGAAVWTLHD